MFRKLIEWIDRRAIEAGARAVGDGSGVQTNFEAAQILDAPSFFTFRQEPAPQVERVGPSDFTFPTRVPTGFRNNDLVRGRFWNAGCEGQRAVLLVHGWNADGQYKHSFPRMAKRLNRLGLAAAAIELPFHSHRRPDEINAPRNFISSDLKTMVLATKQGLDDLHATALWLKKQGHAEVFIWGFSLGAWLAGLLCCSSSAIGGAVLVTPVSRMDLAIDELAFCKPVKHALEAAPFSFQKLNLTAHQPLIHPESILVVQSIFDLFVGEEQVEELCGAWHGPERWRVKHGHVSILFSGRQMRRISNWIAGCVLTKPRTVPPREHGTI